MLLSSHRHSAKLLHHHHTSYVGLAGLLAMTALGVVISTSGWSGTSSAGNGMVTVKELVPGAPPAVAPTITSPQNGAKVNSNAVVVSGACLPGLLVAVAEGIDKLGSVSCRDEGRYTMTVSLSPGNRSLVARQYDGLDQPSPPSNVVNLTYILPDAIVGGAKSSAGSLPASTPSSSTASAPLRLSAPYHFSYQQPGETLEFLADLKGGTAPYAIQIDWGDGTQGLLSRAQVGIFSLTHNYSRSGNYAILLRASDSAGATAFFQTTLVVNGVSAATNNGAGVRSDQEQLQDYRSAFAWPLLGVLALVVGSFWLGERYDRRRYRPQPHLVS